jgi:hypothetical protein
LFVRTRLESRIVLDLQDDGSGTGTLGAGVDAAMVRDIIENDEVLMPTLGAATLALRSLADLEPNESGGCDRVSVGIEVDVQPAFILRQP